MRSRLTAIVFSLVVALLLVGALLAFPGPARAQEGCPATYTIRRGDTLYSLARRYNTTVGEMMRLNRGRIWNSSVIYAGQVICVPAPVTNSRVAIEATYQYEPALEESLWSLMEGGGFIGQRVVYPLTLIYPIDTVSTTQDLVNSLLETTPPPVLLGVQIREGTHTSSSAYTLVAIGDERILTSLVITDVPSLETIFPPIPPEVRADMETKREGPLEKKLSPEELRDLEDECWVPRPVAVLGRNGSVSATLWLESGDGLRYPFNITQVDFVRSADKAWKCYSDDHVTFALFPAGAGHAGEYRISLVLTEDGGLGPPGRSWQARCSGWTSGWFHRWLRSWYGCPR